MSYITVIPWLDHSIQSCRHPEFISGFIIEMLKQVQHDFLFLDAVVKQLDDSEV